MISIMKRSYLQHLLSILFPLCSLGAVEPPILMTLDPNESLKPGQTLIWSPTAQACWDQMRLYHGLKKIHFDEPDPITDVLNGAEVDVASTFPPGTVIYGGDDSPERRAMIRAELQKKAGPLAAKMIGEFRPPGQIGINHYRLKSALFVSCIAHAPKFPVGFDRDRGERAFHCADGKKIMVRGFGAHDVQAGQIGNGLVVLADDLKGGHVLRLPFMPEGKESVGGLILIQKPGMKTLGELLKWARDSISAPMKPQRAFQHDGRWWRYTHQLNQNDTFWMPKLKASLVCDHAELINKTYLRAPVPESSFIIHWKIVEAQQMLNFSLDEAGAMTQMIFKVPPDFEAMGGSGGSVELPKGMAMAALPEWPKRFTFDKPFLAALWRKGAEWPYLACWVDSGMMMDQE